MFKEIDGSSMSATLAEWSEANIDLCMVHIYNDFGFKSN